MNLVAEAATLTILALALMYAGVQVALSKPNPGMPDRQPSADDKPASTAGRAVMMVAMLTVSLTVLATASRVYINHLSLIVILLTVSTAGFGLQAIQAYLSSTPARIAARAALAVMLITWLAWPGWLTATILAAALTVAVIPNLQFNWSFKSLAIVGLVVAFGYDAVQVWLTHGITTLIPGSTTPVAGSVTSQQWLPIMYYAPGTLSLHAPPGSILGVGDIVIPAVLIVAAGRIAHRAGRPVVLRAAFGAYAAALITVQILLVAGSGAAFPVTVLTIPAVVAAVWLAAVRCGIRPLLAATEPADVE